MPAGSRADSSPTRVNHGRFAGSRVSMSPTRARTTRAARKLEHDRRLNASPPSRADASRVNSNSARM